jgi:transaldolase
MQSLQDLKIKLFADGADIDDILRLYQDPKIKGFTTNPTLMRKAGVTDYEGFSRSLLAKVHDRPISLEVFADDIPTMRVQAKKIASWGKNVNVKIPVTNTLGEATTGLIHELAHDGIELNITAIMTTTQVQAVAKALNPEVGAIVSVFAGRVADTGVDPIPLMEESLRLLTDRPKAELLWASPREVLNVFQADAVGTHIITATPDILAKLKLFGKDLAEYSLDTVKMFRNDAVSAGFTI